MKVKKRKKPSDKGIACDEEFSDSEDEGEGGRRDRRDYGGKPRKRLRPDPDSQSGEKKEDKPSSEGASESAPAENAEKVEVKEEVKPETEEKPSNDEAAPKEAE